MPSKRGIIRFYIGLPDLVVILLIFAVVWRPVANFLFRGLTSVGQTVNWPSWLPGLGQDVIANLIAGAIIAITVLVYIRFRRRHELAGRFDAFEVNSANVESSWGEVRLVHPLIPDSTLGNRMRMRLKKSSDSVVMEGEGVIIQDQHFVGFYREVSNTARRRCGAFFMTLNGNADGYEGEYVFLDPDTNKPTQARARWKQKA